MKVANFSKIAKLFKKKLPAQRHENNTCEIWISNLGLLVRVSSKWVLLVCMRIGQDGTLG